MNLLLGSVGEAAAQLRRRAVTAVELCEAALQRQAQVSGLNLFITPTAATAREAAEHSQRRHDSRQQLGPLDGIPFAVKDNFCTRGIPTTCGSKMLQNYSPPYSATVVERLARAGAVLIGKTNLDEFAMGSGSINSFFGATKNIYRSGIEYDFQGRHSFPVSALEDDDWYVSGGSSGGSALAVATGSAFVALGSDTGGSTRNPCAYCGVVGLKPSYGLVPRWGLVSLVNSLDTPGLMGRHVEDVAALLAVVAGLDSKDATSVPSNLKNLKLPDTPSIEGVVVGIPRDYHCPDLCPEVVETWTRVADLLEDSGAQVREVSMPHTKYSIVCYSILNPCEVASNFTRYTGVGYGHREEVSHSMEAMYALTRSAGLSEVVRCRILVGNYFLLRENKDKYFHQALKVRRLIWEDFQSVWSSGVDLLLTPTTISAALRYSEFSKADNRTQSASQDYCTQAANLSGVGAVSVPVGVGRHGLPLALQLMAPWGQDAALLTAAKWLEQNTHFPRIHFL